MNDHKGPPGYVPLTIHELGEYSNQRPSQRSKNDRNGGGAGRNGGRSSDRGNRHSGHPNGHGNHAHSGGQQQNGNGRNYRGDSGAHRDMAAQRERERPPLREGEVREFSRQGPPRAEPRAAAPVREDAQPFEAAVEQPALDTGNRDDSAPREAAPREGQGAGRARRPRGGRRGEPREGNTREGGEAAEPRRRGGRAPVAEGEDRGNVRSDDDE